MSVNKDSMVFQFMLKEYEKLYSKFEMHYNAVEKSINFYIIIVGAIISLQSLIYKKEDRISLFSLTGIQMLLLLIVTIFGYIIFLKVLEHRILIIAYVKSLNLNRKWFLDNSEDTNLSKYFFFKADVKSPEYYKKFRHFYWEAIGLATMNSIILSLLIINGFIRLLKIEAIHALAYNCFYVIAITAVLVYISVRVYKSRGNQETEKLRKRIISNDILG